MRWIVKRWRQRRAAIVPVIRLSGVIGGRALGGGALTARSTQPLIERAFASPKVAAVGLLINSPGGAPAQTSLIACAIRRQADENKKPVIAFVEDVAASGGYWLACAADEIFIDESSIVGSIGVISAGFGFTEAMKKLGVERRLYTAGSRKSMLDPFSNSSEDDIARLKEIQVTIHGSFKDWVIRRRGSKIKDPDNTFDGRIAVGQNALDMGLADGFGHAHDVLAKRFGDDVKIRLIEPQKSWMPWRQSVRSDELIDGAIDRLATRLDAEFHWGRFGL